MTMQIPLAAADARLAATADRAVDVVMGGHAVVVDHAEGGPTPLELMTGALAACSAMSARTHLERDGDRGDIEVVVTLDAGPPTLFYRRVILPYRLDPADAHRHRAVGLGAWRLQELDARGQHPGVIRSRRVEHGGTLTTSGLSPALRAARRLAPRAP